MFATMSLVQSPGGNWKTEKMAHMSPNPLNIAKNDSTLVSSRLPSKTRVQHIINGFNNRRKIPRCCLELRQSVPWIAAAKKDGNWYPGVLEEAERFVAR